MLGFFTVLALTAALADPTSVPVTVATPASATPPTAEAQAEVCKTVPVTGTRFPTRVCHSKREWADMAVAARDFVDRSTEKSTICGTSNACK